MPEILDEMLRRLDSVRQYHGYWMARCPNHEDTTASLDIKQGTEQPVVLLCRAGCATEDVLARIGLTLSDISADPGQDRQDNDLWTPFGQASEIYRYTDEDGVLLYEVLRVPPSPGGKKQFPCRVPDHTAKTGWRWKLGGTRRVLYRLPRLHRAIEEGEFIWLAEGEKDVHALERAGVIATCNPGGTGGGWTSDYSETLRGAIVIIIADADQPGRDHARKVAASLENVASAVEIREAATGKDVSDHLAAGLKLSDLLVTDDRTADRKPELAMDLLAFVAQPDPPENWVVKDLLERGDRLIWTGEEGLGKTTVTRQVAVAAAAGIHPFELYRIPASQVLFLDCENRVNRSRRKFRELVQACQAQHHPLAEGAFRIVHRPGGMDLLSDEDAQFVYERVNAYRPDLVVIGPLYKLHAIDANEEMSARAIAHVLDLAVEICDSALIVEAHSPHGTPRSLRPRGSSLFMGWPDQGYGIYKPEVRDKRHIRTDAWRGPREEYKWPTDLVWGGPGDFPWVIPGSPEKTKARERTWGRSERRRKDDGEDDPYLY